MVANVYVQRKVISHHPAFRILFLVILETMMIPTYVVKHILMF